MARLIANCVPLFGQVQVVENHGPCHLGGAERASLLHSRSASMYAFFSVESGKRSAPAENRFSPLEKALFQWAPDPAGASPALGFVTTGYD